MLCVVCCIGPSVSPAGSSFQCFYVPLFHTSFLLLDYEWATYTDGNIQVFLIIWPFFGFYLLMYRKYCNHKIIKDFYVNATFLVLSMYIYYFSLLWLQLCMRNLSGAHFRFSLMCCFIPWELQSKFRITCPS